MANLKPDTDVLAAQHYENLLAENKPIQAGQYWSRHADQVLAGIRKVSLLARDLLLAENKVATLEIQVKHARTMGKIKSIALAVGLFILGSQAQAQIFDAFQLTSVPSTLAAGAATNVAIIIDLRQHGSFEFTLRAAGTNATSSTVVAHFLQSVDSVTWDSAGFNATLTLNGTTTAQKSTNFYVGALPWAQLAWVTNNAGVGLSNVAAFVKFKGWPVDRNP